MTWRDASLVVQPCRSLCSWHRTDDRHGGQALFACAGCGSQWTRDEPWAPRQLDGSWPEGVREELTRGRGAGSAGSAGS